MKERDPARGYIPPIDPARRSELLAVLTDPLTCNQPNKQIARYVGVDRKTVRRYRRKLQLPNQEKKAETR